MIAKIEKRSSSIASVTPEKSIRKFDNKIITTQQLTALLGGGQNAIVEESAEGI